MPALVTLIVLTLLPAGAWSMASGEAQKQALPKKSGIYAMTPQGAVELKVSGERHDVDKAVGLKSYYSPDSFAKIPIADSVQSFYVSAMGWAARGVYLVVGRGGLTNMLDNYQRFAGRVQQRGAVAFEIQSADLESPEFILRAIRKLAPTGVPDADLEVYLVLDLKSTAEMSDRTYPIRIRVPKG